MFSELDKLEEILYNKSVEKVIGLPRYITRNSAVAWHNSKSQFNIVYTFFFSYFYSSARNNLQ